MWEEPESAPHGGPQIVSQEDSLSCAMDCAGVPVSLEQTEERSEQSVSPVPKSNMNSAGQSAPESADTAGELRR